MMSAISGSRDNQPPAVAFAVAGQRLTVAVDDDALAALIRRRYAAFATDIGRGLAVAVWTRSTSPRNAMAARSQPLLGAPESRNAALPGERTTFHAGVLAHSAPGCRGWVDVAAGTAELWLGPGTGPENVDYFLRLALALALFDAGGMLLHAAAVERGGRAYVFLGPSGSGKTTIARLSPAGSVLNDDLVGLAPAGGGWRVYATPFTNPTQVEPGGPASALLARMVRLAHGAHPCLAPIDAAAAVAEIAASVPVVGLDPGRAPALLARANAIARSTDVARLTFRPDPSFWPVVAPEVVAPEVVAPEVVAPEVVAPETAVPDISHPPVGGDDAAAGWPRPGAVPWSGAA